METIVTGLRIHPRTAPALRSYCLTYDPDNLHKYGFPSASTIQLGQIILVWQMMGIQSILMVVLVLLFRYGEPVILSLYKTNTIVDQCPAVALDDDISYGRTGTELNWFYFERNQLPGVNTT